MNETTERFLNDIAKQIGYHNVVEVHLFQPIRQGGQESGVAVVAALPDQVVVEDEPEDELAFLEDLDEGENEDIDSDEPFEDEMDPEETPELDAYLDEGEEPDPDEIAERSADPDESVDTDIVDIDGVDEENVESEEAKPASYHRHVVYTARYRATLKGSERGKWEIDIKAEADAPLITVDQVVRGVGTRSGDVGIPKRLSADEFRAIVQAPEGFELALASPPPLDTQLTDMPPE